MRYQSGRMGVAEGLSLAFFVTFPTLFQSTPAFLAETAGTLSWAIPLIGGITSGGLLAAQLYVLKRYPGDFLEVSEKLLGKYAAVAIGLFFWLVLFTTACIWTRQFAENTLLTALPDAEFNVVVSWYVVTVVILIYLGIETVARTSYILLPFTVVGLLVVFAGLTPILKPLYFFPWAGYGLDKLSYPTVFFTGLNAPLIILLLLAPAFQTREAIQSALLYGFGASTLLRGLTNLVYTMTFGAAVASEKALPFYEMARLIYINKYVQRLEAVFTLLWVVVGVLGITICLYGSLYIIARLCRLPTIRPLILPMSLIMTQVAALLPDEAAVVNVGTTLVSYASAPGVLLITLALLAAALTKGGKKTCDAA